MTTLVIELVAGPALAAAAGLAAWRCGEQVAGVVSAIPAVAALVLVLGLLDHGRHFVAAEATATLAGLVALAAFAAVYADLAVRGWPAAVGAGWLAAALASAAAAATDLSWPAALAVATSGLLLAARRVGGTAPKASPRRVTETGPLRGTLARMAATAALVAALSTAAGVLGATVGGALTALPALACVLTVHTHVTAGRTAAQWLLRGMLAGMAGFAAFCALVAALITSAGPVVPFSVAAGAAIALQAVAAIGPWRTAASAKPRGPAVMGPPTE